MSGSVTVEPDPGGRAGYAVIRVRDSGQFSGPADFRLRRDDYNEGVFGAHGWQVADELLPPDVKSTEGNDLLLQIGPWIVQNVVSGVYHFAMPAAKLETTLFWPDLPLLAQGSSNMVAEPARKAAPAEPASRPRIQRQIPDAADGRIDPGARVGPAFPVPADPAPDTERPSPAPGKPDPSAPPVSKSHGWMLWAALPVALILIAAGGYYAYRTLHETPPPPVPGPVQPEPAPREIPVQPSGPTQPNGPDLQHMTAAEALRGGASPEALLREGQRRMQSDPAQHGDALLLMQGAADRDYAPAHAALGRLYDPGLPHVPDIPPDPRQAALHYRAAARGGDASVDGPRAGLKSWLEQQAQRNDLFAPLILKEFWP